MGKCNSILALTVLQDLVIIAAILPTVKRRNVNLVHQSQRFTRDTWWFSLITQWVCLPTGLSSKHFQCQLSPQLLPKLIRYTLTIQTTAGLSLSLSLLCSAHSCLANLVCSSTLHHNTARVCVWVCVCLQFNGKWNLNKAFSGQCLSVCLYR